MAIGSDRDPFILSELNLLSERRAATTMWHVAIRRFFHRQKTVGTWFILGRSLTAFAESAGALLMGATRPVALLASEVIALTGYLVPGSSLSRTRYAGEPGRHVAVPACH